MKLDYMILANYAENQGGLQYIMGGAWDTITVNAPLENAPPGVFAIISGSLAIRLLFHQTETNREHTFAIRISDADGKELGKVDGGMRVEKIPGLPPSWDQGVSIVVPLTGFPLPGAGQYVMNLMVDDQWVGDRSFRVIKGY